MINPLVNQLLDKIREIHDKKNHDYATKGPYENFERAAELISWFNNDEDKTFVNHIATKLARLATLLNSQEQPNNESIDDSFLDLCTYCILWATYHQSIKEPIQFIDLGKLKTPCSHYWELHVDKHEYICKYCNTILDSDLGN